MNKELIKTFVIPTLSWSKPIKTGPWQYSNNQGYNDDMLKWKAKFVEDKKDKNNNCVEIRKYLMNKTNNPELLASNLLVIVYKDRVVISTNGRGTASFRDIEDMQNAILEAKDYLENK